jgi:hypothetical protein
MAPMSDSPTPSGPLRGIARSLGRLLVGRLAWLIGAPLLVLGCGFLMLWWSLYQQRDAIATLQARATQPVQARLVERFFHIVPTDLSARPSHSSCDDVCRISLETVAVFEFERPEGGLQRVQFESWAHDWQHNTAFELGIPLLHADFRIAPHFHSQLRAERSNYDAGRSVWERFWAPVEDAGHWLLRLRDPLPAFVAPLRIVPDDPATAILDLPGFMAAQARERGYLDSTVATMLLFVGVICVVLVHPAVKLMLHGASSRVAAIVTVAICASLPLWALHAGRIAPWLSDHAGALAEELAREFGAPGLPAYVSRPVTDTSRLRLLRWELARSPQAAFLAGLETALPPGFDPLDHAAAFDALQAGFDRQLQAMPEAGVTRILRQLQHFEADTVWELFLPALLRIASDETVPRLQRAEALEVLEAYARDWALPDVDVFLYRHRLDNYARLREAPDPGIRALATSRLAEAEARLARQQQTM